MLVAPALAAEQPKTPAAPTASTATPAAPAASKTDAGNPPVSKVVNTGKDAKTAGKTDLRPNKTPGTAPAAAVKTIKADKNLKAAPRKPEVKSTDKQVGAAPSAQAKGATDETSKTKTATVHHRMHSHRWYLVHRGRHPGNRLASKGSSPVKRADVQNQDVSGKATQ
jgi:hypothetical protein